MSQPLQPYFFRLIIAALFTSQSLFAQIVTTTANDTVPAYAEPFRAGVNMGIYSPFTDQDLARLAHGDADLQGVGARALRPALTQAFLETYGYDSRLDAYKTFDSLSLRENTVIVGFPDEAHRDPNYYCPDHRSELPANLYAPIWDNGENGTPVNDTNYYALYLWKMSQIYSPYIRFWEVWNEPGLDFTFVNGYAQPGQPGNWWDNNPDPCDYKLRAPIFHYIRLLRISYEVLKASDPDAIILCGGVGYPSFLDAILRNTDNPIDGSVSPEYPLKGGAWFDAVGYHSYPHFDGTTRTWDQANQQFLYARHSDAAAQGMVSLKTETFGPVLQSHGYDGNTYPKKLWNVTEINLPRRGFDYLLAGDTVQRNFIMKAYALAQKADISEMFVYALAELKDTVRATDEFDQMGLYTNYKYQNGFKQTRTDAGIALETMSGLLFGKKYDPTKSVSNPNYEIVAFKDAGGRYTYVLWAKTQQDLSETAEWWTISPFGLSSQFQKYNWDASATGQMEQFTGISIVLTATPIILAESGFSIQGNSFCSGTPIAFQSFEGSAQSFKWSVNGLTLQTGTSPVFVRNFQKNGWYEVGLKVTKAGVTTEHSTRILVKAKPAAEFDLHTSGGLLYTENLSLPHNADFAWNLGDGLVSSEIAPIHTYAQDGIYQITLTASNTCGADTATLSVPIDAPDGASLVGYTADDSLAQWQKAFLQGAVFRFVNGWTDEGMADIAAGNILAGIKGVGVRTGKFILPESFFGFWGYDIRRAAFEHYGNLDMGSNLAVIGFPSPAAREPYAFCAGEQSNVFRNLYADVWDGGLHGTPINEQNPFAWYVWQLATVYGNEIDFWQVLDAPDYDASGKYGWLPSGSTGNWWDHDPEACQIASKAPIETYVRMLRIAYEVIKTVDPQGLIVLGGIGYESFLDALLRNSDDPIKGEVGTVNFPKGGGAYFDAIGFNINPIEDGSTSRFDQASGTWVFERHSDAALRSIQTKRAAFEQVLEAYGYGAQLPAKRWLISECRATRQNFTGLFSGSDAQRNFVMKALIDAQAKGFMQLTVNALAEYAVDGQALIPDDAQGLYLALDNTTPAEAIKTPMGIGFETNSVLLRNAIFDSTRTAQMLVPDSVAGYAFLRPDGQYVYALWAKTHTDQSENASAEYTIPVGLRTPAMRLSQWDWSKTGLLDTITNDELPLYGTPVYLIDGEGLALPPIAAWQADTVFGCAGLEVHYSAAASLRADSLVWNFEGGSPAVATGAEVSVTYVQPGVYGVQCTATNAFGTHTYQKDSLIRINTLPQVNFSLSVQQNAAYCQNLSVDADSVKWIFSDGEVVLAFQFTKYFVANGNYTAQIIAYNACGSDTATVQIVINLSPSANFTFLLPQSCHNYQVGLINGSMFADSVQWIAPGGFLASAHQWSSVVGYLAAGQYEVTLIVWNAFGADTLTQTVGLSDTIQRTYSDTLCFGEQVILYGQTFDAASPSGSIFLEAASPTDCDTLLQVALVFEPQLETTIFDTLSAATLIWCGQEITTDGVYPCVFTSVNGCDSLVTLIFWIPVSTQEQDEKSWLISALPNPTIDAVLLQLPEREAIIDVWIMDASGRLLMTNQYTHTQICKIRLEDYADGVYLLRVQTADRVGVLKVVKMSRS